MKNIFFLTIIAFIIFSCGNGKSNANSDSLKTDSALKAQLAFGPLVTEHEKDTFQQVTLPPVMEGDLVFQIDTSEQCIAFGKATKSKYNNVGIIFIRPRDNMFMVLEAKDSVHVMPLMDWVNRGKDQHVVLMRLKKSKEYLTPKKTEILKKGVKTFKGKLNDHYFSWTDDEIYCSEMIWKIFHFGLKIDLSTPKKLSDFDLTDDLTKQQMKNKYKGAIPKNEEVVAPDDIMKSEWLEVIYEN